MRVHGIWVAGDRTRRRAGAAAFAVAAALAAVPAVAQPSVPEKSFSRSDVANPRIAKRLGIPMFFALPDSARGDIPDRIRTTDTLIDFRHPDDKSGTLGLRVVETARAGMADRLGKSGLFQTGDLILSFWPEWGGAGAYPNVQMGVSHVGIAYVKDGKLHNIDNPLTAEYNAPSDLRSSNYRQVSHMHIVRPRNLTDAQRANLQGWIDRFVTQQRQIFPSKLAFNSDYQAPKYRPGQTPDFVRSVAQMALGTYKGAPLPLYCSEFAWSLLSLKSCDPARVRENFTGFAGFGMPSCVQAPMTPLTATGDFISGGGRSSSIGLADGPLAVIEAAKLQGADRQKQVDAVFAVSRPDSLRKMSSGHRDVAKALQPKFAALSAYYSGVTAGGQARQQAMAVASGFNAEIAPNYSPTSFLINTLLPANNSNRTMDYIATIVVK